MLMLKNRRLTVIIYTVLLLIIIPLYINMTINDGTPFSPRDLLAIIIIVAGWVYAIYKTVKASLSRNNALKYEELYKNEIAGTFEGEERASERRDLLLCLYLYNTNQAELALPILKKLRFKCQSAKEHAVVLLFIALANEKELFDSTASLAYMELLEKYQPDCSVAWSNLGVILEDDKYDTDEDDESEYDSECEEECEEDEGIDFTAAECYEKAIKYDPSNAGAYVNLAQLKIRSKEYDEAISLANRALDIKPTLTQASNTLYLLYLVTEDGENAEKYRKISLDNGVDEYKLDMIRDDVAEARANELPVETADQDALFFYSERFFK